MRIGEFCERLGIGRETVRHYERLGLLSGAARASNNYRELSEDDVRRIAFVKRMKAAGFTLAEIAEIDRRTSQHGSASRGDVVTRIDGKLGELEAEAAKIAARIENLRRFRAYLLGGSTLGPEERSFLRIREGS